MAQSNDVTRRPLPIAVLVSGGGRTIQNLADRIAAGTLDADIVCVISSQPKRYHVARVGDRAYPADAMRLKAYPSREAYSAAVFDRLRDAGAELVVLAGWLNKLVIPDDFAGRIINIHPGLLPSFGGQGMYGHHVHEAVLAAGCKVSGCSVHFADQEYDTGPIIVQQCVPVRDDDTPDALAARVFAAECEAYPRAIQLIAEGRVRVEGRVTRIAGEIRD